MIYRRNQGRGNDVARPVRHRVGDTPEPVPTPFPLQGDLIDGAKTARWLIEALAKTTEPVTLCSGYLRSEALRAVLRSTRTPVSGKVLVRWRISDLISGASDLGAYTVARGRGLEFYLRLDFHGKVYCVPDQGIMLGSANATASGLGLHKTSNSEVCTLVSATQANIGFVEGLFASAHRVDDTLFERLSAAVEKANTTPQPGENWPPDLQLILEPSDAVTSLMVADCFWTTPTDFTGRDASPEQRHDFELLGLTQQQADEASVMRAFVRSRMYRWLVGYLRDNDGASYFGALSAALHNSLLDDPGPSRRDVKSLLQNLLWWCMRLPGCSVQVDQPNYSQRVSLSPPTR